MLRAIWYISLVLSTLSLLVMVVLIINRVLTENAAAKNAVLRKKILSALVRFSSDHNQAAFAEEIKKAKPLLVADASLEFLGLVRGEDRGVLVSALEVYGLPKYLMRELRKGNRPRRLQAAEMLANFPNDIVLEHLHRALAEDRSREVRIAAAISLADLQSLPELSGLLACIGVRGQRSLRLVELFRKFPLERASELREYASDAGQPNLLRAAMIQALSTIDGMRSRELFEILASDPAIDVAAAAVSALGQIGHSGAKQAIVRAMESSLWEIRAEGAEAAGQIGDSTMIDQLANLLDDEVWAVRYASARAIRQIGDLGVEALKKLAAGGASRRQRMASLALSEGPAK